MNIKVHNISGPTMRTIWNYYSLNIAIDYEKDMSLKKANKIFLSNCAQFAWNHRCFWIIHRKKMFWKATLFFKVLLIFTTRFDQVCYINNLLTVDSHLIFEMWEIWCWRCCFVIDMHSTTLKLVVSIVLAPYCRKNSFI